jgi:hypothetical protein
MILFFRRKVGLGTENGTGTMGADERATAGTDKFIGFANSLKAGC